MDRSFCALAHTPGPKGQWQWLDVHRPHRQGELSTIIPLRLTMQPTVILQCLRQFVEGVAGQA